MKSLMSKMKSFFYEQKGAETAEYAIVVAIIATLAVALYGNGTASALGLKLVALINAISVTG